MIANYAVIDVETNILNSGEDAVGGNKASPFHKDNGIVYAGVKNHDGVDVTVHENIDSLELMLNGEDVIMVGHNLSFDIHHLWKADSKLRNRMYENGVQLWDTMVVEYLLTGQDMKFAGLDALSEKYKLPLKDKAINEYWELGVDTADIPRKEIIPYLKQDVLNTEQIFLHQLKRAHERGMLPLIMVQMDALLATIEMEWNGMWFDKEMCEKEGDELLKQIGEIKDELEANMKWYGVPEPLASSNMQIEAILYGGDLSYTVDEPVGRYKTGLRAGERKYKKVVKWRPITAQFDGVVKPEWRTPGGKWSVADGVITTMLSESKDKDLIAFLGTLCKYRKLEKDYNTYYKGYAKLVWPDGLIHPNFNHCSTNTGRLSSSAPNFQNVAGKD